MNIIDAHCHFHPEHDLHDPDMVELIRLNRLDFTEKGLLKDMKEAAITRSVLISERFDGNDFIREKAQKYPGRFSAVATLNRAKNIKRALARVDRDFKKGFFVGLKFYLGYQPITATDRKWDGAFRLAMKYDAPVIFHTGDTLGGKGLLKYSHPLALDELAVKYPRMKIVIAHFGNPWMMDAAEVVYKNPNVHADLSGLVIGGQKPGKYLRHALNSAISYCGAEKLMFGSDYPLIRQKDYVKFISGLDLTKRQKEKIFYNNAKKLFNL